MFLPINILFGVEIATQPAFSCSKLTIETLEQSVKYVQSKFEFFSVFFLEFRLNMQSKSPYSIQMHENSKKVTEVSLNASLIL